MNRTFKILAIMLIAIMLVMVATPVFAAKEGDTQQSESEKLDVSGMIGLINENANKSGTGNEEFAQIAGKIVGFIRNLAVIAGVILLSVIGIKFMMGSPEEKSDYKKSLVPLAVGIIVVMAATQIITMIFGFF